MTISIAKKTTKIQVGQTFEASLTHAWNQLATIWQPLVTIEKCIFPNLLGKRNREDDAM